MYQVNFTDKNKTPININEGDENNTSTDISLFGRIKLEYGQQLDETLLHLLENFSAPELPGSTFFNSIPNFNQATYNKILSRPINGQLWYNNTRKKFYFWNGIQWFPITNRDDYAANWGVIADGYQLPRPVSSTTGYVFDYNECIWSVSPAHFGNKFDMLTCATDSNARVIANYRMPGSQTLISDIANYLIIGIRSNTNHGTMIFPPNITPSQTPTRSQTPTPTPQNTVTPTPTRTPPNPSVTPPALSPTPTPSSAPQIIARFYNAYNSSQTLTGMTSFCNLANHLTGNDNGYDCNGNQINCLTGNCAPKPGDITLGPELQMTVTGGVPPYTIRFTNWVGNFTPTVSSCFNVITTGSQPLSIQSGNTGVVNANISLVKTIPNNGGSLNGSVYIKGNCGNNNFNGIGTFSVIISDSIGNTKTYNLNWNISRYNSNN